MANPWNAAPGELKGDEPWPSVEDEPEPEDEIEFDDEIDEQLRRELMDRR